MRTRKSEARSFDEVHCSPSIPQKHTDPEPIQRRWDIVHVTTTAVVTVDIEKFNDPRADCPTALVFGVMRGIKMGSSVVSGEEYRGAVGRPKEGAFCATDPC